MPRCVRQSDEKRGAFTLIELLVVVSLIALLIAILLPVLTRTRELAQRTVCAGRQRQVFLVLTGSAADNHGLYPSPNPDSGDDHLSWVSDTLYNQFVIDLGLVPAKVASVQPDKPLKIFDCPDREDWEFVPPASLGWKPSRRLGFNYMIGRGHPNALPWPNDSKTNPWKQSPQRVSDSGNWVVVTDVVESGTLVPKKISAAHTANGSVAVDSNSTIDPTDIGSEGINIAYNDGSVRWRPQSELSKHPSSNLGSVMGWW